MLLQHFKIVKILVAIAILSLGGCAGVQVGSSDATAEHAQTNNDEEWRYGSTWQRTQKVAPLFSKTVVLSDKKKPAKQGEK